MTAEVQVVLDLELVLTSLGGMAADMAFSLGSQFSRSSNRNFRLVKTLYSMSDSRIAKCALMCSEYFASAKTRTESRREIRGACIMLPDTSPLLLSHNNLNESISSVLAHSQFSQL